ncbi:hypothetical protein IWQ55_000029 [Labrenzia sp. EL_208]|nr:hypothetical protein [Labrenzia sp. EL_132]MBG6226837.1 hypothetical protein [Labrenzia sp. EL_208]
MTYEKNSSKKGFLQPELQPRVSFEKLLNLMLRAQYNNLMFLILDECENAFHHRHIHKLSLREQKKLHALARDEIARYYHRNEWEFIECPGGVLQ